MRIHHRIRCRPSWRVSSVKARGAREGREERGKGDGWQKNAKRGNESNIELKLYNVRYHRNCFQDFSNKMQINAAKNTCDQTRFDKAPFNYILKIILNKLSKKWNTNELLDVFRNKGSTESNTTRLVNTSCLIENTDWWGYNTEWYANHLAGSQQ